jgi:hypothetical protein
MRRIPKFSSVTGHLGDGWYLERQRDVSRTRVGPAIKWCAMKLDAPPPAGRVVDYLCKVFPTSRAALAWIAANR